MGTRPEFGSGSRTDVGKGRGPVNAKHLPNQVEPNPVPKGPQGSPRVPKGPNLPIGPTKILSAVHPPMFISTDHVYIQCKHFMKNICVYSFMKLFMIFKTRTCHQETMKKFMKFCHTFVTVLSRAWRTQQPQTRQSWPPHACRTAQHGHTAWPPWLRPPLTASCQSTP